MNYPKPSGPEGSNPKSDSANPDNNFRSASPDYDEVRLGGKGVEKPDIVMDENIYKFVTNVGMARQADLEKVADESIPANVRKYVQRSIDGDINLTSYFQEICRRGFGIIPELDATDHYGSKLSHRIFSFYQDAVLPPSTSLDLQKAIEDKFPKNHNPFSEVYDGPLGVLSKAEIAGFLDEILSEERFAFAQEHYRKHLESQGRQLP